MSKQRQAFRIGLDCCACTADRLFHDSNDSADHDFDESRATAMRVPIRIAAPAPV